MRATLTANVARAHHNWSRLDLLVLTRGAARLIVGQVRGSRKPWIGALVVTCAVASGPVAGATGTAIRSQALPPPVAGQTVNAKVRAGIVRYRVPGAASFVKLVEPTQVPIGTTFDTTAGRVTLTSAADAAGATQHAWFYEGTFTVGQTSGPDPVTTLSLAGRKPSCSTGRAAAAATKRKQRHLWGDGKGRFRTAGQFAAATVRGTRWVVIDRCDGTLTRVVRGSVSVRDEVRHVTVVITAGHEYLAKAPRSK
jgi:hypothetical protein